MPEGPEIRRAADNLARVLEGRATLEVRFCPRTFPHLVRHGRALSGQLIDKVEPRGKAMLTHFAGGRSIYSHNQLYGEWMVYKGVAPSSHLQTRLTLRTATHTAVLYSASDIEVLARSKVNEHAYIAKLGLEILAPGVTVAQTLAQVALPKFNRRNLAGLLLDQSFIAGLGNYLRSDILFAARLHPDLRPADLTAKQLRRLAQAALSLTRRSYRTAGITNSPQLARRLKAQGWAFGRYRHWVFDRAGEPCHACGTTIVRIERGRALFMCPACQPAN